MAFLYFCRTTIINKPKNSKTNPIPVLNLSQKSLLDEKWKEIEGFDGIYFISNLGRIKSISRLSKGTISVWKKGVIKKLLTDNKKGGKPSCLLSSFSVSGRKFQMGVARLVYYHFVRKFELSDKKIKVRYKDDCCLNLSFKNLILDAG